MEKSPRSEKWGEVVEEDKSEKLPEFEVSKMFSQHSNPSIIGGLENSENNQQLQTQNPNEAEFSRHVRKRVIKRERSDIVKRLGIELSESFQKTSSNLIKEERNQISVSK